MRILLFFFFFLSFSFCSTSVGINITVLIVVMSSHTRLSHVESGTAPTLPRSRRLRRGEATTARVVMACWEIHRLAVAWVMGDPQVTMGFDTNSWSNDDWMIWGTPILGNLRLQMFCPMKTPPFIIGTCSIATFDCRRVWLQILEHYSIIIPIPPRWLWSPDFEVWSCYPIFMIIIWR